MHVHVYTRVHMHVRACMYMYMYIYVGIVSDGPKLNIVPHACILEQTLVIAQILRSLYNLWS